VRGGDCTLCHDPHGAGPRLLAKEGGALCAECHEVQAGEAKKAKGHPPVAKGECLGCHAPHGSENEPLLVARTEDLCLRCHASMYDQRAGGRLHRPFAARRCSACHVAHGEAPRLLASANPCASCHGAAVRRWGNGRSHHAPVAEGRCAACHEPHGNAAPRFLRARGKDLCLGCHEPLAKRLLAKGATVHAPVAEGECDRCHEPHAAGERKLLTAVPPALCADCHEVGSAELAKAHAPWDVRASTCTSCHDPHVSARPRLVADRIHPPFEDRDCEACHVRGADGRPNVKPALAAVCGECHDLGASGHEPVAKGRCASCHSPHASPRERLLVEANPALCDRCHDRGRPAWKKLHADAGAEGLTCGDCHDAHMKKK
jgi:predicted CXXCH cytochrome family protein